MTSKELEAIRVEAMNIVYHCSHDRPCSKAASHLSDCLVEIEQLREALQTYGEHSHSCQETSEQQYCEGLTTTCSCGFERILAG